MNSDLTLPDADPRIREIEKSYLAEFERDRNTAEFFVLSFPKSGRTWHRALLGSYLATVTKKSEKDALLLKRLCRVAKVKQVVYSHNGANFRDGLPAGHPIIASPSLWRDRPVLLLVRNPKDILVSAYHQARYRAPTYFDPLSDFIRDPAFGIDLIMTAYRRWHANRHVASSFDVISYEMMHRDTAKALRDLLSAIGAKEINDDAAARAVEFCRFEQMQEHEDSDFFQSERLRNAGGDPRARKVREGKVGGFEKHLTAEDEAFIDARIREGGDPFASYYQPSVRS